MAARQQQQQQQWVVVVVVVPASFRCSLLLPLSLRSDAHYGAHFAGNGGAARSTHR